MTVTLRTAAAVIAAALLLLAAGYLLGQGSRADARPGGGSTAVVKQLKKLNRTTKGQLSTLNQSFSALADTIGTSQFTTGSIFATLGDIEHNTDEACQALKGSFTC